MPIIDTFTMGEMSALTTTDTEGTVTSEEVKEGRFEVWLVFQGEKVERLARSDKLWVAFRHAYGYLPVYPNSTVLIERDGKALFRLNQKLADFEQGMWADGWHPFLTAFLKLKEEGKEEDRGGGPAGLKSLPGGHRTTRFATEAVVNEVLCRYGTRYVDVALFKATKERIGGRPHYGSRKLAMARLTGRAPGGTGPGRASPVANWGAARRRRTARSRPTPSR